jgi:mannan endo-1,4-beta-mannosidase
VAKNGYYALRLRAAVVPGPDSITQLTVDLDETRVGSQRLPVTGAFTDTLFTYPLYIEAGEHILNIGCIRGSWDLDSYSLEPLTPELQSFMNISHALATKDPLPQAQRVFDYLISLEGKGTLSGQQIYSNLVDVNAVYKATGKYPAILGCDLIDFSPSRVERGASSTVVGEAIKWWRKGGLVSFCWHWNAPTDLIDKAPDRQWFSGFYSKATTFNFKAALNKPEGDNYKLLLRDIDAIALQLKKLEKAGVVVLWRPLHEASGGWFWWGTQGPDAYIRLYKLVFDRLENYHNLKNLIWVWNGEDPEWYPGDEYVDVLATDVYPQRREYGDRLDRYLKTKAASYTPKLVAMSENGTLPDINAISAEKLPWSWFCTWNGEFTVGKGLAYSSEYTEESVLKGYYDNPWLITRDELPPFVEETPKD